jgi:hypothetical protein
LLPATTDGKSAVQLFPLSQEYESFASIGPEKTIGAKREEKINKNFFIIFILTK